MLLILGKQAVKNDALITRPVWSLVLIVNAFFLHVTHLNSLNVLHRGVGREGAGGAAAPPPDFGGSEGAAGQRRRAALLPAPPDF